MPHPRHRRFPLWALLLALLVPGCKPAAAPEPAATGPALVDDEGRALPGQPPQRVVPLAPNVTELLYAIGAGARVAGDSVADAEPPPVEHLPRFNSLPMDFEALVALRPDLVVAATQVNNPRDAELFTSLDIPVAYFSFERASDVPRVMRILGEILALADSANAAAARFEHEMAAFRSRTAALERRPGVLFLIGTDPLFSFGSGSYIHDLIEAAGGRSLTADIATPAPTLNEEFVLTAQPDVILGTFGTGFEGTSLLRLYPSWAITPALRDGRVYSVPPSLLLRPGPRLVDGVRAMAQRLHPDRFPDTDDTPGS